MFDTVKELPILNDWGNKIYLVKYSSDFTENDWHIVPEYTIENQDEYSKNPRYTTIHTRVSEGRVDTKGSLFHEGYEGFEDPVDIIEGLILAGVKKHLKSAANELKNKASDIKEV
jgi:hypothetical protein